MRHISRDSFARFDFVRETIKEEGSRKVLGQIVLVGCDWCEQVKETTTGLRFLYRYGHDHDSIRERLDWDNHLFCSVGCYRAYHGY